MPLSNEAFSTRGGSLCFSEWDLQQRNHLCLTIPYVTHAIIPSHRSLWPNGSIPKRKALSLLAEQTLRHKG